MNTQVQKQTGIRLPENLIIQLKNKAKSHGVSFNAYVQHVLTEDVNSDIPYIDPERHRKDLRAYRTLFRSIPDRYSLFTD